jgi:Family of unknown function (DUF6427)
MLLRILKSNTLFSTLLIPLIALCYWMGSLRAPEILNFHQACGAMPLYYLVYDALKQSDFLQVFIAFCLVILNSLFIAQLGSMFLFLRKRSFLPGIIYLITVSSLSVLHNLLPVHIATTFVLISLFFIFDTFHKKAEITYTYNAAFFMAIATLFYLPVVVLFPLVWISIFVLQKNDNWRLLAVPVLGFGVPWLFMWFYAFMNNAHEVMWKELIKMLWIPHNEYLFHPYFLLMTAVVAILTTIGCFSVVDVYQRIKVSSRKYFVICYWILGLLLLSAVALISISIEIIALLTIPVSYFIAQYLLSDSRPILKEVFTWILVATTVVVLELYKYS